MTKETLCVLGGDTHVESGSWRPVDDEALWIVTGNEGGILKEAICLRPFSCKLRDYCTGKVRVGESSDNSLGRPLIHEVYFNSSWVIDELEHEQDYGRSNL